MQTGDVVRLKTGGPKMTVEALEGQRHPSDGYSDAGPVTPGEVGCVWFTKDDEGAWTGPHRSRYAVDALTLL